MNVKNCTSGIKNMDIKVKNLNISIDAGGKAAINGLSVCRSVEGK